jgi:hypothetical protein
MLQFHRLSSDLQNKNFRFSEFMEHTFSSKQIVSKVTRKYESLLDLAFLKVYPAKFYQVSDYRLFQQYFSYIMAVSFIGGGNQRTRRKPLTCRKSLTNFTT